MKPFVLEPVVLVLSNKLVDPEGVDKLVDAGVDALPNSVPPIVIVLLALKIDELLGAALKAFVLLELVLKPVSKSLVDE